MHKYTETECTDVGLMLKHLIHHFLKVEFGVRVIFLYFQLALITLEVTK